jgi:hypothetical protein
MSQAQDFEKAAPLFITAASVVYGENPNSFNARLQHMLDEGYVIHGQLNVSTDESFSIMVVKYDPRLKTLVEKAVKILEIQLDGLGL